MQPMIRPIIKILYWMLIVSAVMIGILRLAAPHIQYFKSDIENLLRQSVLPDLSFSSIELEWRDFDQLIHLQHVKLTPPNTTIPIVVETLSFKISLWRSLLAQTPVIDEVNAVAESLVIRKDLNKQWWLNGISLIDLIPPDNKANSFEKDQLWSDFFEIIGLAPEVIKIEIENLTIDDILSGQQHQINNSLFEMQRHQGVVRAKFNTNLDSLGGELSIQGLFSKQKGVLFTELNELELSSELANLIDIDIDIVMLEPTKLTNANVWLNLDAEKPPVLRADFTVDKAQPQVEGAVTSLPFSFNSQVSIQKLKQDWSIIGHLDQLVLNGKKIPKIETQLNLPQLGDKKNLSGWIKSVDLSILAALDNQILPDAVAEKLLNSDISGQLNNVWFDVDPTNIKSLSLMTQLHHLTNHLTSNQTTSPVSEIPGFNDVSASLLIGNQNLKLKSTGKQLTLDFADKFRAPIEIDSYSLEANASLNKNGLHIAVPQFEVSNSDISLAGRLLLDFDQTNTPFMYLRASFDKANAANKSKYLPIKLLSASPLAWIDNAIEYAEITQGNLLYHGRLKSIRELEDEKSGGLYVDFQINNAAIMFDPEWSTVRNAKSMITFDNVSFLADVSSASFDQIDNVHGQVSIADLSMLTINLNLHANAETNKALSTWLAMPTSKNFRNVGSHFKNASGQVQIETNIALTSSKTSNSTVNVGLEFKNAGVNAPDWDIELQQLNGHLLVTQDEVLGKDIKAHYFNDPITINVNTDQENSKTLIQAAGLLDTQKMMSLLPEYMSKSVTGKSDWQVQLAINNKQTKADEPILKIKGLSSLKNTKVELPIPLFKSSETLRKTAIEVAIYANDMIDFNVRHGPDIRLKGDLETIEGSAKYQLKSMDLALSKPLKPNNAKSGFRLYGTLPLLPVDDWLEWYQAEMGQRDTRDKKASSENSWDFIKSIDVQLQSVVIERRQFTDVDFFLTQEVAEFWVDIKSSLLTGHLTIPKKQSPKTPIIADLEYIKFQSLESSDPSTDSTLLPNDFYNLNVFSKVATYNDHTVDNLEIETRLNNHQLVIQKFNFQRDKVFLNGKGLWEYDPANKKNITSLNLELKGSEFGQAMANLDFGDAIGGGEIEFNSHLTWPNSLLNFEWDSLTGNANFVLKDGVLKDVEPGSGRLIGLLSLNALPRRLLLGFSDVVGNGLEFNKISGNYIINGEKIITSDTKMDSSSAEVLVTGVTGLKSKTYDQKMFITPNVGQTLPVLGGLIAGGAVGWGLLLFEKIFEKAIDKTVTIEYTINGTWEDPNIVLVKKSKTELDTIKNDK
jgi:uncharacterized protein (TIGR02099 family)